MIQRQRSFVQTLFFCLLLLLGSTLPIIPPPRVIGYSPGVGHQTQYDYGFISIQSNRTAADILYWTGETVTNGNYTLKWHQYVNLSITVINLVFIVNAFQAFYDISVDIHSNHATISNSSWNQEKTLNGSVPTPVPTGIDSSIIDYPAHEGLLGFFLSEDTLVKITTGTNVTIGDTLWNSITVSTFNLKGNDEICYQLHNLSITATERLETTYKIEQDVGIYFTANDTRTLTTGGVIQTVSYYYSILDTSIPLIAPPNPLLILIVVIIVAIILVIVAILIGRILWRRLRRVELPPLPEEKP